MENFDNKIQKIDICKLEMGMRFRVFREIVNRSISQLADELGISATIIEDYEEGRTFPDIQILHYLYEHYGLNVNWLVGRVGEMFNEKDPKQLRHIFATRPPSESGASRFEAYLELFELMEIPVIEESIMAALLEVKTLLKKQALETVKSNSKG